MYEKLCPDLVSKSISKLIIELTWLTNAVNECGWKMHALNAHTSDCISIIHWTFGMISKSIFCALPKATVCGEDFFCLPQFPPSSRKCIQNVILSFFSILFSTQFFAMVMILILTFDVGTLRFFFFSFFPFFNIFISQKKRMMSTFDILLFLMLMNFMMQVNWLCFLSSSSIKWRSQTLRCPLIIDWTRKCTFCYWSNRLILNFISNEQEMLSKFISNYLFQKIKPKIWSHERWASYLRSSFNLQSNLCLANKKWVTNGTLCVV